MPHADPEARKAYRRLYGRRPEVIAKRREDQRQRRRVRSQRTEAQWEKVREQDRIRYRRKAAIKAACAPAKEWRAPVARGPKLAAKLARLEALGLDWHNLPRIAAAKFCSKGWGDNSRARFDDLTQTAAEAMLVALIRSPFPPHYCKAQWASYMLLAAKCKLITEVKTLRIRPEGHIDDSDGARQWVEV